MHNTNTRFFNWLLLLIRAWLCFRLIGASYSSVIDILTSAKEREFFRHWFGNELHFPIPVVMAFLAKGAELVTGALFLPGLFTKPASIVAAFTMAVATVTANLGENFIIDGGFTISYTLFSLLLIICGPGKYSLDYVLFKKNNPNMQPAAAGQ